MMCSINPLGQKNLFQLEQAKTPDTEKMKKKKKIKQSYHPKKSVKINLFVGNKPNRAISQMQYSVQSQKRNS